MADQFYLMWLMMRFVGGIKKSSTPANGVRMRCWPWPALASVITCNREKFLWGPIQEGAEDKDMDMFSCRPHRWGVNPSNWEGTDLGAVWEREDQAPVLPRGGSEGPDWPPLPGLTWQSASCQPAGGQGEDLGNGAGVSKENSLPSKVTCSETAPSLRRTCSVCISAHPQGKREIA